MRQVVSNIGDWWIDSHQTPVRRLVMWFGVYANHIVAARALSLEVDPFVLIGLYLLAVFLCVAQSCWRRPDLGEKSSFEMLSVSIVALSCLRWSGLPQLATDTAREFARFHGWYAARRLFQGQVIGIMLSVAAIAVCALMLSARNRGAFLTLAYLIVLALLTFVLVRAVSLHQVDRLFALVIGGHSLGVLIEATMLTSLNALLLGSLVWRTI